ncbi:hypothetical protein TNIN_226911, partial [Trichonephila inaurata madagascariensis]
MLKLTEGEPPRTGWGYNSTCGSPYELETEHKALRSLSIVWLLDLQRQYNCRHDGRDRAP